MFWKKIKKIRKGTNDERTHINPTISVELKTQIERLAFIIDQPIQFVALELFIEGINHREVIERYCRYFRDGGYMFLPTIYFGHESNQQLVVTSPPPTDRISIRLCEDSLHDVDLFSHLFQIDERSKVLAVMISAAIRHSGIVEDFIRNKNRRMSFDEVTVDEIKKLMAYVDKSGLYRSSWNDALIQIVYGVKKRPKNFRIRMTPECVDTETYRWNFDNAI